MFDVGFWELIILFGLGLVILGPERLPKVAMQVGNWAGQARRMARNLTNQMRDEMDFDVNKPFTSTSRPQQTYNRPGMDDLKPQDSADLNEQASDQPADDLQADSEPDDRDHSDAGTAPDSESNDRTDAAADVENGAKLS
jgi:sec-independent protein translocase protein TatB